MHMRDIPLSATFGLLIGLGLTIGPVLKAKERPQVIEQFAPAATVSVAGTSFIALPTTEWDDLISAQNAIQAFDANQYIQENVIVSNDGAQAYFAAAAYNTTTQEELLSIYSYENATNTVRRLYHDQLGKGASAALKKDAWPVWHAVGIEDDQLIILLKDGQISLGECDELLLVGIRTPGYAALFSLVLNDPHSGLTSYHPSQEVIAAAEAKQTQCNTNH